jgi:hypothetical protein
MSFLISLIKIILFPIFAIVILEKSLNDNIVHSYFNSNNRDRWELLTIVWLNNFAEEYEIEIDFLNNLIKKMFEE